MQEQYGWYSPEAERELAKQVPTPPVGLHERAEDGVLVPVLRLTRTKTPPQLPGIRCQGLVRTQPTHAYTPSPYPLPKGRPLYVDEHLPRLLAQRSWLAVDFVLDALGFDDNPLPLDKHGITALLKEVGRYTDLAPRKFSVGKHRELGRVLLKVSPPYLRLLKKEAELTQPWTPFLELGFRMVRKAPPAFAAENLALLHVVDCGRRNVQQAAYLWGLEEEGALPAKPSDLANTLMDQLLQVKALLYPSAKGLEEQSPSLKRGGAGRGMRLKKA